jgi:hypothetical protein
MLLNVMWQINLGPEGKQCKKEAPLSRAYPGWTQHGDTACAEVCSSESRTSGHAGKMTLM